MKTSIIGSLLFCASILTVFSVTDPLQIVFADKFPQQEIKKTASSERADSVTETPKQSPTPDDSEDAGIEFKATAYCLRGRTASGEKVRKGIIAADPRVLPLGSSITILRGPYAGDYLVADTGGRIKGKKIDIWMASCAEAIRFGHRSVFLRIPDKEDG
jgi:3D (Asp-Asp-Asp) domain-containing protein